MKIVPIARPGPQAKPKTLQVSAAVLAAIAVLSACGVQTNKLGYIKVNEKLETNVPSIYVRGEHE